MKQSNINIRNGKKPKEKNLFSGLVTLGKYRILWKNKIEIKKDRKIITCKPYEAFDIEIEVFGI